MSKPIQNILIISHAEIGTRMAGPGIRYHYMAETLQAAGFDVTVGFFSPEYLPDDAFERSYNVESVDVNKYHTAFERADAVIALWVREDQIEFCNTHDKLLVIDIYGPVPVENLAVKVFSQKEPDDHDEFLHEASIKDYRKFLASGDAFLYSNQRQLDFWMGFIFGAGLTSPKQYLQRDAFRQFIPAPFGIDTSYKFKPAKPRYKGVVKGIKKDDIVMIWSGGIYDWYDGETLVEAMELVAAKDPRIKMVFPAIGHPNKHTPKWRETIVTQERAKELGVLNKNVFFFEGWIDYLERNSFLDESDIAIYTHKISIESEFSHRTRVIDSYILFNLPTIATDGDYFADVIKRDNLGRVVPEKDKKALADAIINLAKPANLKQARQNLERVRPSYDWKETLKPLVRYLQSNPQKTPQTTRLERAPIHDPKYSLVKRAIPVPVKKAIVRSLPAKARKKLLG